MSDINFEGNSRQRTPCVLVLDCSGSMEGDRINQLNAGLREFKNSLTEDPVAMTSVSVCIVSVGGPSNSADVMMDFVDAIDFEPIDLKADGTTPLGEGIILALNKIEDFKKEAKEHDNKYTRPWLFVMSDGEPTDDSNVWSEAVKRSMEAETGKKAVIFSIAIGNGNTSKLQEITQKSVAQMSGIRFKEFFVWLSGSLSKASKTTEGTDVQLPARDSWSFVSGG